MNKSIRPRHESSDIHTNAIHYFHSFAVKDRVDMSSFSDNPSLCDNNDTNVFVLLPSENDNISMRKNVTVIISRLLRKHFKFFKDNVGPILHHIPHKYSQEMPQKSHVVSTNFLKIYMY